MRFSNASPNLLLARVGAVGWMIGISAVLSFVIFVVLGFSFDLQGHVVDVAGIIIVGTIFVAGLPCLTAVIFSRCPHCGKQFFRNSDGLGTYSFRYHPSCPRRPGINPLVYQTVRCAFTGRMRCIHCGQEIFPTEPAKA